jgi:hypothetical protein
MMRWVDDDDDDDDDGDGMGWDGMDSCFPQCFCSGRIHFVKSDRVAM